MPLLACPAVLFRENSRSLLDKPAVAPFSSTRHSKFDKGLAPSQTVPENGENAHCEVPVPFSDRALRIVHDGS